MNDKLCCIFTTAPHYRGAIYKLIDKNYRCYWFFNDCETNIKRLDYNIFEGPVTVLKHRKLPFGFTYQKGMLSLLFKPYDRYFVFLYSNSISTWLFLFLSKFFPRKRVYGWTHGWYGKETKTGAFIKKLVFKRADEIFTYGNYARELMIKEGFKAEHIHTLHNSLDYERQVELRNTRLESKIFQNHFGNDNPVLIFIGRLTPIKKLDMLILAIADLKAKGEVYNLVFVGDGLEKQKLESLALKLKVVEQIWFYGACYDEKTNAELIFNADLCVAPGNVGLTAMHTMVFGTPVISHNDFPYQMPEFEAIKSSFTGDFFINNNLSSLVDAISKWFKQNVNRRDEIRRNCYEEIDTQWNPNFQISIIKNVIK
jgi:glycosyltransferase involved in cell wall biosynthesis